MVTIKDDCCSRLVMCYDIPKVGVTYFIVCCLAWPCYSMKKMSTISTNSAPSGKLFSLGTMIESSNVASTAIVEFLINLDTFMMAFVVLAHTLKSWTTQIHDAGNATEQL